MEYFVLPFIGGIVMYVLIASLVRTPGRVLARKFVSLGNMKGMSYSELVKTVGNCSSISDIGNGCKLRQWIVTGYHIAIVFDENDRVVKISHEASV